MRGEELLINLCRNFFSKYFRWETTLDVLHASLLSQTKLSMISSLLDDSGPL